VRRSPLEGGVDPRARRTSLEGGALLGRSGGPWGPSRCGLCCVRMFCVRFGVCLCFVFFAGFKQDSPRLFRRPSWLSPTVAPEHLWACRPGSRRCWSLLIGRSSLPVASAFPWGCVSGPAGLALEALQERECFCKGFFAEPSSSLTLMIRGTCSNPSRVRFRTPDQ
jgi:hypothetical protein